MANTVDRAYRYPTAGQEPDVNGDIQRLAEDVSVDVQKLYDGLPAKTASGSSTITITTNQASTTVTVNLPAGFTVAPNVFLQSNGNVAGRASLLFLSAYGITTSSFTVKIQTSDNANIGTTYAIPFSWLATQE